MARLEASRHLGVDFGLDRVRLALARLGDPQQKLRAVQIAGTNGKGSTAAMTEAILRAAGWRTGLYTSPHLSRFTERFQLSGREVEGGRLAAIDARIEATAVPLTYFEIATVLAFALMAEEGVQAAVLETGLGGRLDAVTACSPVATAITSIGFDHQDLLGPSLRDIAREKAGIAKPGVPLFLGPVPPEADEEIARAAAAVGAPLRRVSAADAPAGSRALAGAHQATNAALAVALARVVAPSLRDDDIGEGLRTVVWPGRLERVAPDVLLDGAHNEDGARALVASLPPCRPRALVISVVRGKDAAAMLAVLASAVDTIFVTRSRNARSMPTGELAALAAGRGPPVRSEDDPAVALSTARSVVGPGGLVVVAGSLFLVGQLRAHLLGEPTDPDPGDPLP